MKTKKWRCNLCHKIVESETRPESGHPHNCVRFGSGKQKRRRSPQGKGRHSERPRLYNRQFKQVASKAAKYEVNIIEEEKMERNC